MFLTTELFSRSQAEMKWENPKISLYIYMYIIISISLLAYYILLDPWKNNLYSTNTTDKIII